MWKKIKGYFIAGLLVLFPFVMTIFIITWLFTKIDSILMGVISSFLKRIGLLSFPGLGFISVILIILLVGVITRNYIGKKISLSIAIDLIICVIVGGLIYIFMLFFLREFNSKENIMFKRILTHILPSRLVPDSWRIL